MISSLIIDDTSRRDTNRDIEALTVFDPPRPYLPVEPLLLLKKLNNLLKLFGDLINLYERLGNLI